MGAQIDHRGFAVDESGLSVWDLDNMAPDFLGIWQVIGAIVVLVIMAIVYFKYFYVTDLNQTENAGDEIESTE